MTTYNTSRYPTWFGLLPTLLAAYALTWLAQALSSDTLAYGRNSIYQHADWPSQAAQALWLQTHVGNLMIVVIGCGAMVLHLTRYAFPKGGFLCGATAIWFAALGLLQTIWPEVAPWQWLGVNVGFVVSLTALAIWPFVTRGCKKLFPHLPSPQKQTLRCHWHYPVFALLTGIGVLIWLDYAARGPAKYHNLGVRQLYYWVGAVAIYTLVAGLRLPVLSTLAWLLSRVDHVSAHTNEAQYKRIRWLAICVFLVWLGCITLIGHKNKTLSATTSELLRTPIYVLVAWALYRWYGQRGSWSLRVWGLLLGLSIMLTCALKATGDNGPILVMTYTAAVFSSVGVVIQWFARYPRINTWGCIGLATVCVLAIEWGVVGLASLYSDPLHLRLQTLEVLQHFPKALLFHEELKQALPVSAYDFLLRLHWFMQNTPTFGFGLGHIPWCGYEGHIGGLCSAQHGVPWQIQSDYSFVAWVAVGGPTFALLMLAFLVMWFWQLLPQASDATRLRDEGLVNLDVFGLWVVAIFALSNLVQIGVSVLGTLALTQMTGVTLPLMSYGGASLLTCAFFAGLGATAVQR